MKVVVAPDSFKGSLTAVQAAQAMAAGIRDADPSIETVMLPAADGGEGTMSSLVGATGGRNRIRRRTRSAWPRSRGGLWRSWR